LGREEEGETKEKAECVISRKKQQQHSKQASHRQEQNTHKKTQKKGEAEMWNA
jgi:hypothetical protein